MNLRLNIQILDEYEFRFHIHKTGKYKEYENT